VRYDPYMGQMKHQLDATLCRFYFCRVTLHVLGASAHHQGYLKLVQRPLVHVLSLQVSHHISLLGPELYGSLGVKGLKKYKHNQKSQISLQFGTKMWTNYISAF
jgi:hypothetical protein